MVQGERKPDNQDLPEVTFSSGPHDRGGAGGRGVVAPEVDPASKQDLVLEVPVDKSGGRSVRPRR